MKKRLLNWTFKFVIALIFASLTVSVVVLSMALYDTYNTKKDLQNELKQIEESKNELASTADESQSSYQSTVDELEDEVESLTKQNESLASIARENTGVISGEVAQIITPSEDIGDFQIVCAQSSNNSKQLFCVSIPSVKKSFSIVVPVGKYFVFASPLDLDTIGTKNKAYYTEYVQCLQSSSDCDSKKDNPVELSVAEGSLIDNIAPIDLW